MIVNEAAYEPGLQDRLKAVRSALGLSSVQLSKSIDIEPYQWERFESGDVLPSIGVISSVGRKYRVSKEYLVFGAGDLFTDEGRHFANQTIRDRLISLRGERTAYSFAKLCGIGLPTYEAIENGTKEASIKQIRRIAEATGVGEKWLLTGDEKAKDYPVNDDLIAFLDAHPEIRKGLWNQIGKPEELDKKLKERRMALGLTQKQVAELIGVQRVTIVEIEAGGHRKDYALMDKVRRWVDSESVADG